MRKQGSEPPSSGRKLTQWLARRFLLEAIYTDRLAAHDLAAAFALEDGEYHYIAQVDLDPLERKIAAAGSAERARRATSFRGAAKVDGLRLSLLRGKLVRILQRDAAKQGQTLEQFVDQHMLGW